MTQDTGYRIQDSECGTQGEDVLNPESGILNPASVRRIHWRCRRGLLELDIVLGRFVERHYAGLEQAQRTAFDALLDVPDTTLWDMITGKASPSQQDFAEPDSAAVLELLRSA